MAGKPGELGGRQVFAAGVLALGEFDRRTGGRRGPIGPRREVGRANWRRGQEDQREQADSVKKGKTPASPQCRPRAVVPRDDPTIGRRRGSKWILGLSGRSPRHCSRCQPPRRSGQSTATPRGGGHHLPPVGHRAADKGQRCADGWAAGIEARTKLRHLISGHTIASANERPLRPHRRAMSRR